VQHSSLRSASSLGRSSKLSSFFFVQRVSLSFCAFLAGCFSHPYWLAGAAGFEPLHSGIEIRWAAGLEPLHLEIRSAERHPASTGSRRRSGARDFCKKRGSSIFNSRCASSSPSQSVSNASHMKVTQKPRGTAG
jgi:hypothetical protein